MLLDIYHAVQTLCYWLRGLFWGVKVLNNMDPRRLSVVGCLLTGHLDYLEKMSCFTCWCISDGFTVVLGSVTGAALRLEVVAQITLHWAYNVEAAACWIRLTVAGVLKKGNNQQFLRHLV
jgi:hypothetical protein